jgi:hypothetical protein
VSTPTRIYIESTALVPLGGKFENVDFEKLLELRASAGFRLFVSEISWLEYVRKRKKDLSFFAEACSKAERVLEKHAKSIPEVKRAAESSIEYLRNLDAHFREKATDKGITIVPLVCIGVDRLLKMSIECIPPYEEAEDESKEKGFRDSLIMFSILDSLRDCPGERAIVISADRLLGRAFKLHADEYGADLIIVKSYDEAAAYVADTLVESERVRIREESAAAVQMLNPYKKLIAAKISEIREVTDRDLGQGFLWSLMTKEEQEGLDIRSVRSIELEGIDSAIWKHKGAAVSQILFRCQCKVTVVVPAPYRLQPFDEPRRFKVGEPPPSPGLINYTGLVSYKSLEPTEERKLPFSIYGAAEFQRQVPDADWRLVTINIDKSVPSEEYDALIAAALSQRDAAERLSDG